jgi:predicted dehydrogenase
MNNRRQFLAGAAGFPAIAVARPSGRVLTAAGFPTIVKASTLGLNGAVAPSNRVTLATIGVGWMGGDHVKAFLKVPQAQYVAVCDVDEEHLAEAKAAIDKAYGNTDCAACRAFDEVLLRRDIDAVSLAVPDHWHGIVAVMAARAGKDIYGEKPLAHNFAEGRAIRETVKRFGRIWQTGSWQRSKENFRKACELVRNGRIGKVRRVEVGLPAGHTDFAKTKDQTAIADPPATLNYDRWLGPAPEAPYCVARVHKNWRWNLDYGGGQLMDWIGHHVDIAHWGLGVDHTGPLEIEGQGEYPPRAALWNTATKYRVTLKYPNEVTMVIAGGYKEIRGGTKWIGGEGWVWVNRNGLEAEPANLLTSELAPGEISLPKSPGHYEEFIGCVRSRLKTLTPAEVALRSATPGWLGQIAMLTGRKLRWDPEKERILNDPEAEKLLSRDMRMPWKLA